MLRSDGANGCFFPSCRTRDVTGPRQVGSDLPTTAGKQVEIYLRQAEYCFFGRQCTVAEFDDRKKLRRSKKRLESSRILSLTAAANGEADYLPKLRCVGRHTSGTE